MKMGRNIGDVTIKGGIKRSVIIVICRFKKRKITKVTYCFAEETLNVV